METLIKAAKEILHLHLCEQEGLSSGQPTRETWLDAVDKLSESLAALPKDGQNDMTVEVFYAGFNLDFLTEEEKQTIYTATDLYAKGKLRTRECRHGDNMADEFRMILSHAFLGCDTSGISKETWDLAICECVKYASQYPRAIATWIDDSVTSMQLKIERLEINCFDEDSQSTLPAPKRNGPGQNLIKEILQSVAV